MINGTSQGRVGKHGEQLDVRYDGSPRSPTLASTRVHCSLTSAQPFYHSTSTNEIIEYLLFEQLNWFKQMIEKYRLHIIFMIIHLYVKRMNLEFVKQSKVTAVCITFDTEAKFSRSAKN